MKRLSSSRSWKPFVPPCKSLSKRRAGHVEYEVIFVNDGSTDETDSILRSMSIFDSQIKLVNLSRNFGKEAALSAGLQFASGGVVIPIDCDLQDPPELIIDMLDRWDAGFPIVNGVRTDRSSDSFLKRSTARLFYGIYNKIAESRIEPDAGDFRLLDRKVVNALLTLDERFRFNKALFAWVGFKTCNLPYKRDKRYAGTGKWGYWKLWNFAIDGLTASSTLPLRIWTYVGATLACLSFIYTFFIIFYALFFGIDAPGYASIITVVLFMGGINLLSLGILGEYIGRISTEVRNRPLFIVDSTIGLE